MTHSQVNIPDVEIANGEKLPQVGLGLWQVTDPVEFKTAFDAAVAAGYRHFDDASAYRNEKLLGDAIRTSDIARQEFFVTTKIRAELIGIGHTKQCFADSLRKLQTDYVDLLLLHFPVPIARKKAWKELEKIKATEKAKAIGVSNYTIHHLEEMKSYANEMPAVNQVELHVFLQQPELVEYCHHHNIVIEAYSPLAHGRGIDNPVLAEIAKKHGKSAAQVMLRWCVQSGFVVLPKSVTPERIQANIEIFDFELDAEDLTKIKTLNQDLRTCWNPTYVP